MKQVISIQCQQGVMMIISLIMLLVMTVVGVTTMGNATLQERMAGNNRLLSIARLNAERALREAEALLDQQAVVNNTALRDFLEAPDFTLSRWAAIGIEAYENTMPLSWDTTDSDAWQIGNSVAVTGSDGTTAPRYRIEYIGKFDDCGGCKARLSLNQDDKARVDKRPYVFRITAIGYSPNDKVFSVLESVYMTQQGVNPVVAGGP